MEMCIEFIVILLAHTLGDFYFQTEKMAERKKVEYGYVLLHSLIYAITALIIIGVMISPENANTMQTSFDKWWLAIGLSLAHCAIDSLKFIICRFFIKMNDNLERKIFFIDQIVHFASFLVIWFVIGVNVSAFSWVGQEWNHLPFLPITMILGLLLILKPASLIVVNSGVLKGKTEADKDKVRTGKLIGYLERTVIYGILMFGDLSALGFVIAAKSIARFPETKENKEAAEYYILGTLLSVTLTIAISLLLGLCTNINK